MVILIALPVLVASWAAIHLLRRLRHARTSVHPAQAGAEFPSGESGQSARQGELRWTALDDLQLTRLLIESARRTNTE